MKTLQRFEVSTLFTSKIKGGSVGNTTEEPPITDLGTISNDGSV